MSTSSPAAPAQVSGDFVNDSSILQPGIGSDENSALGGYATAEEDQAQERLELMEIYLRMRDSVQEFEA